MARGLVLVDGKSCMTCTLISHIVFKLHHLTNHFHTSYQRLLTMLPQKNRHPTLTLENEIPKNVINNCILCYPMYRAFMWFNKLQVWPYVHKKVTLVIAEFIRSLQFCCHVQCLFQGQSIFLCHRLNRHYILYRPYKSNELHFFSFGSFNSFSFPAFAIKSTFSLVLSRREDSGTRYNIAAQYTCTYNLSEMTALWAFCRLLLSYCNLYPLFYNKYFKKIEHKLNFLISS